MTQAEADAGMIADIWAWNVSSELFDNEDDIMWLAWFLTARMWRREVN
jgi:hypothetical protein